MPYVKLNLEKDFYMSELWAFKIGANLLYNFGMEFDTDNLRKNTTQYTFDEYKFSSLSFEVFFVKCGVIFLLYIILLLCGFLKFS